MIRIRVKDVWNRRIVGIGSEVNPECWTQLKGSIGFVFQGNAS